MKKTAILISVLTAALLVFGAGTIGKKAGFPDLQPIARASAAPGEHLLSHFCSEATLKGTFGFSFNGTAVQPGPFEGKPGAVAGIMQFDGRGHVLTSAVANVNGTILRRSDVEGTYTVNRDCTGSLTVPGTIIPFTVEGVIVNGGEEILFIGTPPQVVFSGVAKRIR